MALHGFLTSLGVSELPALTVPFDPGYDPRTLEAHLGQSGHLIHHIKISMACWMIANEQATRSKLSATKRHNVRAVAGGAPFEIACAHGHLEQYLDLCASIGFDRIEAATGFTELAISPSEVLRLAQSRGLSVQFEVGTKHGGQFASRQLGTLTATAKTWLDAGAVQVVIEARESAANVGLFDQSGSIDFSLADQFVHSLADDLSVVQFEAPTKASQFALLDHFGSSVILSNVRLEELLRVEIYRRGLHSDAYSPGRFADPPTGGTSSAMADDDD